jgi:hypothetical protein
MSRLMGPCGEESDTTMVTAAGFPAAVSVTLIVLVPLPQTCWTALVTSSEVMISASSAYSPSPCKPNAARTCERATGTDSGMPGKASAISRGPACAAVLGMASGPFVPA